MAHQLHSGWVFISALQLLLTCKFPAVCSSARQRHILRGCDASWCRMNRQDGPGSVSRWCCTRITVPVGTNKHRTHWLNLNTHTHTHTHTLEMQRQVVMSWASEQQLCQVVWVWRTFTAIQRTAASFWLKWVVDLFLVSLHSKLCICVPSTLNLCFPRHLISLQLFVYS